MSVPSTSSTALAAVCIVDSSLAVAIEWGKIFSDYLAPIIQRLAELTSNANQFRIGFITYGLASSRPSPLLCQRFFQQFGSMNKEMKDESAKFSIGQTGIGSSSGGMAALEGIVAALEMFDKFRQSIGLSLGQSQIQQPNKPALTLISHIVHLAAAPPDGSSHPVWNANSKFDQLTWATLPDEFKQRQINYSVITIRPIPRFKEIFLSANSTDAVAPWFDVAPNHTVMLSGLPQKGLKRQTEPTTPTPDPKRPRQETATKPTSGASPSDPTPNSESTTPATNPTNTPNTLSLANMPPAKKQEFMERYFKLHSEIKQEYLALQKAQTDASPPEVVLAMRTELGKKLDIYRRLGTLLPGQKKLPASTGTTTGPSSQPPPPGGTVPTPTATPATDSTPSNPAPPVLEPAQPPPPPPTTVTEIQKPNISNPIVPVKVPYPVEETSQIRHLTQQQNQQGLPQQGGTAQPPATNNPNMVPQPGPRRQWHGPLVTTSGTQHIYVSIEFQQNAEPRIETWPSKMVMTPVHAKLVTPQEFQQWVNQNNGILCRITPQQQPETPSNNEVLLGQLTNTLVERSLYAVVSWTVPNGVACKTLIMSAFRGVLMGAAFPLTGFSEVPQGGSVLQSGQQTLQQPVQQISQPQQPMSPIPPGFGPPRIRNISHEQLAMIRAMQARIAGAGRGAGLTGTGNIGDLPSSTFQAGTTNPVGQQHQQIPLGISLEMMQALMQRKQEGGS